MLFIIFSLRNNKKINLETPQLAYHSVGPVNFFLNKYFFINIYLYIKIGAGRTMDP